MNLVYCFEKSGVLRKVDDENSIIEKMNSSEYEKYKSEGIIFKGMIPKLDNAFEAIKHGVKTVVICHAKDLKKVIENQKAGTRLEL
jgi:acetylglutamate kinase